MVAKNDVVTASREIEGALWEFVHPADATAKVAVFEDESGYLRALIGSGGFKGMDMGERIDRVWAYLRENVSTEHMRFLYGVHPMDLDEYDAHVKEM